MTIASELFKITDRLESQHKVAENEGFSLPLQQLTDAANRVGKAWCGSCLGYHSTVYYADLKEPPTWAHFSQEWGFDDLSFGEGTAGDWREFRFDDVVSCIEQNAGNPSIQARESESSAAADIFEDSQAEVLSLLTRILDTQQRDKFLQETLQKVKTMKVLGMSYFMKKLLPSHQSMSRDTRAINGGFKTPPHMTVLAHVYSIQDPFSTCAELSKVSRRAGSHIQGKEQQTAQEERVATKVFIGHGRSSVWKDLKDFIQDRLHLPWDEFNRVPVAGVTNTTRLSQMLDEAAIAFLIMTAEDEEVNGKQHARHNVIHEAGLFQGRLGFERAIILLEDGCEEFSNVEGLGQIRFPRGDLSAKFEEIRKVLEREGLVDEN